MPAARKTILRSGPVVCAVNRDYHIMVPVNGETLMSVTVNGQEYYFHSNGVRRSDCPVQRFIVPMEELDAAGEYTLHYQKVITRMAYCCVKGRPVSRTYPFHPLNKEGDIHIYVLSDCHGLGREAVLAGSLFGDKLDLLILNGDISSSCMTVNEAMLPLDIAYEITKGSVPCVITRGNHDLRGKYSERLHELMPAEAGRSYYQVCLGPLWLLVLDCGEDKPDDHREYGGTAAYHAFRMEEDDFLRRLAVDPAARSKMVVSHIPVMHRNKGESKGERPFDIETGLYQEWVDLINTKIQPDLYIAGHLHCNAVWDDSSAENSRGINCPVLITGVPDHKHKNCTGAALTLSEDRITIAFSDKSGVVSERQYIKTHGGE